jgi:ankyrin repeat protein
MIEVLIESGVREAVDDDGLSALHHAACGNHTAAIRELLRSSPTVVDIDAITADIGVTALSIATSLGQLEAATTLLSLGASVSAGRGGEGALHWACRDGRADIIRHMLTNTTTTATTTTTTRG